MKNISEDYLFKKILYTPPLDFVQACKLMAQSPSDKVNTLNISWDCPFTNTNFF